MTPVKFPSDSFSLIYGQTPKVKQLIDNQANTLKHRSEVDKQLNLYTIVAQKENRKLRNDHLMNVPKVCC